jgi:hypothetical protein
MCSRFPLLPPAPSLSAGGFSITRPGITLRSAPGHWAVISLPLNDPQSAANIITLRLGADLGVISVSFAAQRAAVRCRQQGTLSAVRPDPAWILGLVPLCTGT